MYVRSHENLALKKLPQECDSFLFLPLFLYVKAFI